MVFFVLGGVGLVGVERSGPKRKCHVPTIFRVNSLFVLGRVDRVILEQLLVFVLSQGPDVMPR